MKLLLKLAILFGFVAISQAQTVVTHHPCSPSWTGCVQTVTVDCSGGCTNVTFSPAVATTAGNVLGISIAASVAPISSVCGVVPMSARPGTTVGSNPSGSFVFAGEYFSFVYSDRSQGTILSAPSITSCTITNPASWTGAVTFYELTGVNQSDFYGGCLSGPSCITNSSTITSTTQTASGTITDQANEILIGVMDGWPNTPTISGALTHTDYTNSATHSIFNSGLSSATGGYNYTGTWTSGTSSPAGAIAGLYQSSTVPTLPIPILSVPTGLYGSAMTVTMSDGAIGAAIYYTTSGSVPTCSSTLYTSPITVSSTETVKAIACAASWQNSSVASSAITITGITTPATWYIRADGGTRYDAAVTTGQCDGKHDAAYPGTGTNQPCAFNDVRYMWDDQTYANDAWAMQGGDTLVIEGCAYNSNQPSNVSPDCRIGWDNTTGPGAGYTWCVGGSGNSACFNPPIPAGTSGQHTRILGKNYASCATGGNTNPKNYESQLTQIFGGYNLSETLNANNAQYVDVECIEITTHNGVCTVLGSPAYPRNCSTSPPIDDYAAEGINTSNGTSNLLLQDVYIHGMADAGLKGAIGGPITMTRMFIGFNASAGWNFDDGNDTEDAPGSSITANYVTFTGNGCNEQYPIVNAFSALSCYDQNTGGFGDSWSGQDTELDAFTCNHCSMIYNAKDGFIGPHTVIKNLLIENSESIGNQGQQWKWGNTPNATTTFINNLTGGNCWRMQQILPGAAQNFAYSSGNPGANLATPCRAAGDVFSFSTDAGSSVILANNSTFGYTNTINDLNCNTPAACNNTPFIFKNDIFLGFLSPLCIAGGGCSGAIPTNYYDSDATAKPAATYNDEFDLTGTCPGGTGMVCTTPLFFDQPSQTLTAESNLDVFNATSGSSFYLATSSSPPYQAGTTYTGQPSVFFDGNAQTSPLTMGALGVTGGTPAAATPTFSPVAGPVANPTVVTASTSTSGCSGYIYFDTNPTPTTNQTAYTVTTAVTLYAYVHGCPTYLDSAIGSAAYTITTSTPAVTSGSVTISNVTIQ